MSLASYNARILARSPVVYYPGQETSGTTADDTGTNNLDGTYTGTYTLNQSGPHTGVVAVNYAGTGYMARADTAALRITGAHTLSAWVRIGTDPAGTGRGIVARWLASGNQRSYQLGITGARLLTGLASSAGTGASSTVVTGATTLALDTWYHVAAVFTPSTSLRIYVNGVEDGAVTSSVVSAVHAGTAPLWIGSQFAVTDNTTRFPGRVCLAAVESAAQSAATLLADVAELTAADFSVAAWNLARLRQGGYH
jgi:hypothetical protein